MKRRCFGSSENSSHGGAGTVPCASHELSHFVHAINIGTKGTHFAERNTEAQSGSSNSPEPHHRKPPGWDPSPPLTAPCCPLLRALPVPNTMVGLCSKSLSPCSLWHCLELPFQGRPDPWLSSVATSSCDFLFLFPVSWFYSLPTTTPWVLLGSSSFARSGVCERSGRWPSQACRHV